MVQSACNKTGKYEYTWNYTCEGVAAEDVFTEELSKLIRGNVLDVGCGHGEYTNRWADQADEVIGYDMTEGFLATANRNSKSNVRYVLGYTHNDGLPFADRYFDVAYTKKGPGSWYPDVNRILKSEADVLSLHPADGNGEGCELGTYFPGLFFPPTKGTPILNKNNAYLADSRLHVIENHILRETTYIPTPEDILTMVCFGQANVSPDSSKKRVLTESKCNLNITPATKVSTQRIFTTSYVQKPLVEQSDESKC